MLRTRIITALVLLPAAFFLLFGMSAMAFGYVAAGLVMVGCWEFRQLAGLGNGPATWVMLLIQAALLYALARYWSSWTADPMAVFLMACLAWGVMFVQIWSWTPDRRVDASWRARGFLTAIGVMTLGWMSLAWLRMEPNGEWWVLLLLLTIWAADVGAYFSGRAIGGAKLAPRISPGKTRAGLYGGLLTAAVVAPLAAWLIPALPFAPLALVPLALVTALVSVGGDLFISLHKRTVGLKDTGRIFPGHGGVLDRLDSLLAGAPFFVLGKLLAGL
ncbi:phosphatidate cytidylyltransferase [Marinihelvus fidelis]|uniref:Phosphatidate cytidylyltransferase n=1 Tax=Marinihelvus fidelis TaxID=2613842 RepID=A0A5N0T636_9GAMM|nr:phosphatidate cytidylyltransferase [Marinihelvus fidelis]KAA9129607.1 phosphatidate cytidylyltransferase [Marinihelvus fidelis]